MARFRSLAAALSTSVCIVALAAPAQAQERKFEVPAGSLRSALDRFVAQSGTQLIYQPEDLGSATSRGVTGTMTPQKALEKILAGSGFQAVTDKSGALAVVGNGLGGVTGAAPNDVASYGEDVVLEGQEGISEILVVGSRSQNVDIRRSEDDARPYVVYSGEEVRLSGALNLEEFFRSRLPMNAVSPSTAASTQETFSNGQGGINLRGLGANQTLILIDGRRTPGVATGFTLGQPNINGIPTSAIERIEVLPTTASGIYGGGATGGVVNIILKRDFNGVDLQTQYGNTFAGDAARWQLGATGGLSLNEGKTRVTFSASHAYQNRLLDKDRGFAKRAFNIFVANFPTSSALASRAHGPTPNIVSATGSNLILDDGTPLNSPWTYVPTGYAGPSTDNGAALATNAGQLRVTGRQAVLYGAPTQSSISFNITHDLNSGLEAYLDGHWDRNESRFETPVSTSLTVPASSSPFQQNVIVTIPLYLNGVETSSKNIAISRRANLGIIARLPFRWSSTLNYTWAQSRTPLDSAFLFGPTSSGLPTVRALAFTDLAEHPFDGLASLFTIQTQSFPYRSALQSISLRSSGPLINLPGGSLTATVLAEARREYNKDIVGRTILSATDPSYTWIPKASQSVRSAYIEFRAPIFSANNARPLVSSLELVAALRRDEYQSRWASGGVSVSSKTGPFPPQSYVTSHLQSTDYSVAFRYAPISSVILRASYGTGFLPPDLLRLRPNPENTGSPSDLQLSNTIDPRRNGELLLGDPSSGLITLASGGNPDLEPERSRSWSYGIVLSPGSIPGLRVSVDVTSIKKRAEIVSSLSPQFILDNEGELGDRVRRAPVSASDVVAGITAGRVVFLDRRAANLFRSNVRAIDFQIDYERDVGPWGDIKLYLVGTQQQFSKRQTSAGVSPLNSVGFSNGPLRWRVNGGFEWVIGSIATGWNTQYFSGYNLCSSTTLSDSCLNSIAVRAQGTDKIPSQTYHDLYVRYNLPTDVPTLLRGTEIGLSVQNVFSKVPPILALEGRTSPFGDPRLRRFTITISKSLGK